MDPENEKARELYSFLSSNEAKAKEMEDLAKAVAYSYKKGGIRRAAARELYGTLLRGSVTRMEGYAGCAYSHFLNHGLGLRAGREYELDLSDMGICSTSPWTPFSAMCVTMERISGPSRTRSGELS